MRPMAGDHGLQSTGGGVGNASLDKISLNIHIARV